MDEPTTRQAAIAAGSKTYKTGKPCINGHIALRTVADRGRCTECTRTRWVREKNTLSRKKLRALRWGFSDRSSDVVRNRRYTGLPEPSRPMPHDNACEICGAIYTNKRLALDHCHKTGKFRGWLCWHCNTALGKLGDSEHGLLKALAYVRASDTDTV